MCPDPISVIGVGALIQSRNMEMAALTVEGSATPTPSAASTNAAAAAMAPSRRTRLSTTERYVNRRALAVSAARRAV